MKKAAVAQIVVAAALLVGAGNTRATQTPFALRAERGTCIYNGVTTQTIERAFGTNLATLPFGGTTTYDFYSPPTLNCVTLKSQNHAWGTVVMANTGTSKNDDFTVTGRIVFYDYDSASGTEVLIVNTGDSDSQVVAHGQTASWKVPKVQLPADHVVPAGHLLHIAVTVTLVSGSPAGVGQFLYNGPKDSSTVGYLHARAWNFAPPGSTWLCVNCRPDGCTDLTCRSVPSVTFAVQATPSLTNPQWVTIGAATVNSNGGFSFTDVNAPQYPIRFYRLTNP